MSVSFDYKKKLGEGHFGEVWLVVETGLNIVCAVKRIPLSKVIDPDNFFHEAQVLKKAEHPNTIKVFDTGRLGEDEIYLTMEYLERGSLDDEAQGGLLSLSRAREIMIDMLRGLEHAHSKGIVHRDIKPANILIGNHGEGVLSDFGLALLDFKSLNTSRIREYEYLLHLAPEVKDVLGQNDLSDIYAAGVTLYRIVNGDIYLPKVLPNAAHLLAQQGKFPDRTKYREFIPLKLKRLINKAMDINPNRRFKTAADMRHDLEQISVVDWEENKLQFGVRWIGHKGDMLYEVTRTTEARKLNFEVITKKGRNLRSMRTIRGLSQSFLTEKNAKQFTAKVSKEILES